MGARRRAVQIRMSVARTIRYAEPSQDSAARGRSSATSPNPIDAAARTGARALGAVIRQAVVFSNSSAAVRTSPSRNKLAMSSGSNAPRPVLNCLRRSERLKFPSETPMNAKVLATLVFALLPSAALAQSSDQTKGKANPSRNETGQGSAPGKNGNGSDANGAATPGGAESDANATTAPSSKPPSQAQ
jgi:hypothetical protein